MPPHVKVSLTVNETVWLCGVLVDLQDHTQARRIKSKLLGVLAQKHRRHPPTIGGEGRYKPSGWPQTDD
jgi:hypothetical protein